MDNAWSAANHLTLEQIENGTRSLTQAPVVSESYKVPQRALGPVVELRATPLRSWGQGLILSITNQS